MKRFSRIMTALLTTSLAGLLSAGCIIEGESGPSGEVIGDAPGGAEDTGTAQEALVPPGYHLINAAAFKPVAANGQVYGTPSYLTDTVFAPEYTDWQDPTYAVVTPPGSSLVVDLGRIYPLYELFIQADCNDVYHVEASGDGATWQDLLQFLPNDCPGLRTRPGVVLGGKQVTARYLRVHGSGGDGLYSVSELQAFVFGEECNTNICTGTSFCCNDSCGICVPKGGSCTQQLCSDD